MAAFEYVFPAIRGVQAGREYYASMCPLRLIPRIFLFDEEELKPELRAQRVLNRSRVPEMARYLLSNPNGYTFSAITASIDGDIRFEPLGQGDCEKHVGQLRIPMKAKFVINDGQHRRAAIESALHENPDLGDETISVVFFVDVGLARSQQMFADLNRYAVRPTTSLGMLYDHRDEEALIAKALIRRVPVFVDLTELEKSSISNRSLKLFTLSGIYHATHVLLDGMPLETIDQKLALATEFWSEVSLQMRDWLLAKEHKISPAELRRDFIHAHTLALVGLGRAGNGLLAARPDDWKTALESLASLDWSRANGKLWEGRAMNAGRLSKRTVNVVLVGNLLKKYLGVKLSAAEQEVETEFRRSRNGSGRGSR
ncbi:MAG: DNA sulfur modification protein DndB [Planctomycetaceae bacterium]